MEEDMQLINKIISGDTDSLNLLMKKYDSGITRFIFNIVKSKEAAEDISQETFISAYYKLHTFRNEYKFSTWLYKIAYNKCMDYERKNKKNPQFGLESLNLISKEISPENMVEFKETKEYIKKFIELLSEKDRKILFLRCSEGKLTFGDIAKILNMGESNVKKRYYGIYEKYEAFTCSTLKSVKGGRPSEV